jgi:hypothetical protein
MFNSFAYFIPAYSKAGYEWQEKLVVALQDGYTTENC